MNRIVTLALALIAVGVALSLNLPSFESSSGSVDQTSSYVINQDSLEQPVRMDDMQLAAINQAQGLYGLRLGLFAQLQYAVNQGKLYIPGAVEPLKLAQIVKANDSRQDWYLLLLGPFDSKEQAKAESLTLLQQQNISATLVMWPLAQEDDEQAKESKSEDQQKESK